MRKLSRELEVKRLLQYFNDEKSKYEREILNLDRLIDTYMTELREMKDALQNIEEEDEA